MINLKEFKQSVLQKAMQGELTKQLPSDGNAKDLLVKIKINKQHIINQIHSKRLKKLLQPLPIITAKEIPPNFNIPKNWKWVRFSSLYDMVGGSQPPKATFSNHKKEGYVRLYQTRDYGPKPRPVFIPRNKARKTTIKGDILVARYGGSLGKIFKANDGAYNVALAKVSPLIHKSELNKDYVWLYLKSNFYLSFVDSLSKSAQSGFNRNDLERLIIPVPPLSEQKRIVAKVHKCFKLADTIQKERELNKKFAHDIKQSLLMEAMQGKLTKQLHSDGNADELLQKIQQKKQALIKAGKIRRHKKLPPISKNEIPFKIPKNWKWTRISSLYDFIGGSQPYKKYFIYHQAPNYIRLYQVRDYGSKPRPVYIPKDKARKISHNGDILVARYGGSLGEIFRANYGAYNVALAKVIPIILRKELDTGYIWYYLKSDFYQKFVRTLNKSAQAGFNKKDLLKLIIPVPPLTEQYRIVVKLNDLFKTVNINV